MTYVPYKLTRSTSDFLDTHDTRLLYSRFSTSANIIRYARKTSYLYCRQQTNGSLPWRWFDPCSLLMMWKWRMDRIDIHWTLSIRDHREVLVLLAWRNWTRASRAGTEHGSNSWAGRLQTSQLRCYSSSLQTHSESTWISTKMAPLQSVFIVSDDFVPPRFQNTDAIIQMHNIPRVTTQREVTVLVTGTSQDQTDYLMGWVAARNHVFETVPSDLCRCVYF